MEQNWIQGLGITSEEMQSIISQPDVIDGIRRLSIESAARNEFNATYNPYTEPEVEMLPALKFDYSKVKVADEQINATFDKLIADFCRGLEYQKRIWEDAGFVKELTKNKQSLRKLAESGNPKALFLLGVAYRWGSSEPIDEAKSGELMRKSAATGYPVGCMGYGFHLLQLKTAPDEAVVFFKKAADYHQTNSLYQVGFYYKGKNPKRAYSYFKLAADLGSLIGCQKIGEMYTTGSYVKQDHEIATEYFKKAAKLGSEQAASLAELTSLSVMESQSINKAKQEHLVTTKLQEAMLICKFLCESTKMEEFKKQKYGFGIPFTFPTPQIEPSNLYKKDTLVLYNLLGCMDLTSKHLLVENEKGTVEKVCIYNWERIPQKKLKLLKLPGTKLVLKYYNRKMARDGLPIYRVDNSDLVEIYPAEQPNTHSLGFEKMRQAGRVLFSSNNFAECIQLYNEMLGRGSKDIVILNSNLAICHMKLLKYDEALICAKKCLQLEPKHPKSLYMVALMLFRLGRVNEAEIASQDLPASQQCLELKKLIQEKLEGEKVNSDFSLDTYRKKKERRKKQLSYQLTNLNRPSMQINMLEVIPFFNGFEEYVRAILSFKGGNYEQMIRDLFQQTLDWRLETHNAAKLTQLATFFYGFLNAKRQKLQFTAQDYSIVAAKEFVGITYKGENYRMYVNKILAERFTFLENEVESAAILLQQRGELNEAIKLYECFKENNRVFVRNKAQLLLASNKAKQCIEICTTMIVKLLFHNQPAERTFQFSLLGAKANNKLKDYNSSNTFCINAFLMEGAKLAPAYYIRSINNLALNKTNEALEDAFKAVEGDFQPEHTLHLCRLLIRVGRDKQASSLLDNCYKNIKESKLVDKNMWQKACLKLQIQQASKHRLFPRLVQCCTNVLNLELRNIVFVEKRLWEEITNNPEDSNEILMLVMNSEPLRLIGEEISSRWKVLQQLENTSVASEESIVRDCCDQEFLDYVDPKKVHQEFLEIKRQTLQSVKEPPTDDSTIDLDRQLDCEFAGYQCNFWEHEKLHVILFSEKLGLDPKQEQLFVMAASKGFCNRFYGSNGIKHIGEHYELKINSGDRLLGRGKDSNGRYVIVFEEKVGHTKAARTFRQG